VLDAEEEVELGNALVQLEQLLAAVANEILAEVVAAEHLQEKAAEVAEPLLADTGERTTLAPQDARRRKGAPGRAAAEAGVHGRPYSWSTTTRSSVISRTA
jgi:hypothetical protein